MPFTANPEDEIVAPFVPNKDDELIAPPLPQRSEWFNPSDEFGRTIGNEEENAASLKALDFPGTGAMHVSAQEARDAADVLMGVGKYIRSGGRVPLSEAITDVPPRPEQPGAAAQLGASAINLGRMPADFLTTPKGAAMTALAVAAPPIGVPLIGADMAIHRERKKLRKLISKK